MKVRLIGFNEYTNHYQFGSNFKLIKIPFIRLRESLRQLKAVNIVDINPITLKEDTAEFDFYYGKQRCFFYHYKFFVRGNC